MRTRKSTPCVPRAPKCEYREYPMRASVLAEQCALRWCMLHIAATMQRGSPAHHSNRRTTATAAPLQPPHHCNRRTAAAAEHFGTAPRRSDQRSAAHAIAHWSAAQRGGWGDSRSGMRLALGVPGVVKDRRRSAPHTARWPIAAMRLAPDVSGPRGRTVVRLPCRARSATPARRTRCAGTDAPRETCRGGERAAAGPTVLAYSLAARPLRRRLPPA
jgi:hypothetical protein